MIKQIDRVTGDLRKQVEQFQRGAGASKPLCVAVVGINHAEMTTSFDYAAILTRICREYDRRFRNGGAEGSA